MTDEWINKYRPTSWKGFIGNGQAVDAMQEAISLGRAKAFLLTGPSGVGKTTLARIGARSAGAAAIGDIHEIDGATHTGIEAMREVVSAASYHPVGESKAKAVVIDEAHALSKAAIQALLKALEEPPPWLYWFLCTTEANRILTTVKTRMFHVDLKPVRLRDIQERLDYIANKEKLKTPEVVIDACADAAEGSVRQAISYLAMCANAKTSKDVSNILKTATENAQAHQLAKVLLFGNFKEAQALLGKLGDTQPESVRYVVRAYVSKVFRGAKKNDLAGRGAEILDAFSQPFYDNAGLDLAVARVLLN
jgi:DNA polymerase-3 subunit gamma/tau